MPKRPPTLGQITRLVHPAPRQPDTRPSAHARGYNAEWNRFRAQYLQQHPWCALHGPPCLATDVDHIIPHKGDKRLFWSINNLQGLCRSAHSQKTIRETGLNDKRRKQ